MPQNRTTYHISILFIALFSYLFILQGCGVNHLRYMKLNEISSNYVQWLTETRMIEFPTTHVFGYDEDTKDKTITIDFTNAAGQDTPTSISRGRNARLSGVFLQHLPSPKYMS